MDQPRALCSGTPRLSELLVTHPYFQPHVTPIQLLNRATEPFLPRVKNHLFAVLENLDSRGLTNHVLIITRYRLDAEDCDRLNEIKHLKVTLLFTYSGIEDQRVEPFDSRHAELSLRLAASLARPLPHGPVLAAPGAGPERLARAPGPRRDLEQGRARDRVHRAVLPGRDRRVLQGHKIPEPYRRHGPPEDHAETLEARVLEAFADGGGALFRKTSCAVSYAQGAGLQRALRDRARALRHLPPRADRGVPQGPPGYRPPRRCGACRGHPGLPDFDIEDITERAVTVTGLDEQPRYYLQHSLGFQVHDARHPHNPTATAGPRSAGTGRTRHPGSILMLKYTAPWHAARLVAVDVEGNGARPPGLVELAVIPIAEAAIGQARTWMVRPASPITWQATRVHGITNEDVRGLQPVAAVAGEILAHLGSESVLVAHNAHVDLDVITRELPGWGRRPSSTPSSSPAA